MRRNEQYEAGLKIRREVLGDEYVDRALTGADDFTAELQEFLNSNCWGYAWTREAIDSRTRSLVTLAILGTLGRVNELQAHTLGALRNGCTPDEIKEVLLHLAVYAGAPAGVEAFRAAQPVVSGFRASSGGASSDRE